jgi:hypothetical protein
MVICIPTKSRPKTDTHKLFGSDCTVYHFVEPQEIQDYKHENVVNIGVNDMGITFVRNFILEWNKENNPDSWFLMCDDDIKHFCEQSKGKTKVCNFSSIMDRFKEVNHLGFPLVGLNYRQLVWTEKKKYKVNSSSVDQAVFINSKMVNWQYRRVETKEDRDFAMQAIRHSKGILKMCKLGVSSPDIGSNKGGLSSEYQNKKDVSSSKKMVDLWGGDIVSLKTSKRGQVDCKINWTGLATKFDRKVL